MIRRVVMSRLYAARMNHHEFVLQESFKSNTIDPMLPPALSLSSPTPLAEWELQSKIREALGDKLTGQIHVSFLNGRTETIFAHAGAVKQVYIRNHRVPDLNWEHPLIRFGRGTLEIKPMPARAMMFHKIMLEEITPGAPQPAFTNQLRTMFDLTEHNVSPTLFHFQWARAQGFMLAGGKGIPIRHAVLLTQAGAVEGPEALKRMSAWEEARCQFTVQRGDIKNQAWLEVHLNILLEWYCARILNHYGQLTGAVMTQSAVWKIRALANEAGWNVEPLKTEVRDASLFAHAAEAGEAYGKILSMIVGQIEPVIGSALTQGILKQANDATKGVYKTIAENFGLMGKASV